MSINGGEMSLIIYNLILTIYERMYGKKDASKYEIKNWFSWLMDNKGYEKKAKRMLKYVGANVPCARSCVG